MKSAFRNLPIKPEHWRWLVMMAKHPRTKRKFYFYDKTVPFGASISCSNFQRVSNPIEYLYKYRTGKRATNYLDDFLFAALLQIYCNKLVDQFLNICEEINFPVALEKTHWATTIIVFLGLLLNTVTQTISVPLEIRLKALKLIRELLENRKTTVHRLQQVSGLLNYICIGCVPGRCFARRMYSKTAGLKKYHHTSIDQELKLDCAVWENFLMPPEC